MKPHAVVPVDGNPSANILVNFLEIPRASSVDKVVDKPLQPQWTLHLLLQTRRFQQQYVVAFLSARSIRR